MKPIEFKQQNCVYASQDKNVIDLLAHKNVETGIVSSLWKLTWWERIKTLYYGKIWCQQMVCDNPLQPQKLQVYK